MIRYLEKEEAYKSRKLYTEAFFEDSESFTDYYYKEKVKYNYEIGRASCRERV